MMGIIEPYPGLPPDAKGSAVAVDLAGRVEPRGNREARADTWRFLFHTVSQTVVAARFAS